MHSSIVRSWSNEKNLLTTCTNADSSSRAIKRYSRLYINSKVDRGSFWDV